MIGVLGAGAFGTALAVALARGGKKVRLWGREVSRIGAVNPRLPGVALPAGLRVTGDLAEAAQAQILLVALPMQSMHAVLEANRGIFAHKTLVSCAKGFSLARHQGSFSVIAEAVPKATPALLSGPGFAAEIGQGLPTALTLVGDAALQRALSTDQLRLYRSDDARGVEVGGALKNVVAIACGAAIGLGLGESARAALMTRGFVEMQRLGAHFGARPETLTGLSGFGDLALTCTSDKSRNYRFGLALARDQAQSPQETVEGVATARALMAFNQSLGMDMPICTQVDLICTGETSVPDAMSALLSRPLKQE